MQQLQQPLATCRARCKLPLTLPQLMGLMQAAQQQGGGLPGGLPGALPAAQTVGVPGAALPASRHRHRPLRRAPARFPGPRPHHAVAPGGAHGVAGEAPELRFLTFSRSVCRKARKSAPILLSF